MKGLEVEGGQTVEVSMLEDDLVTGKDLEQLQAKVQDSTF